MKALTLWQPWASMVAFGEKRVETRCWKTKYRGPIAIHAAANLPPIWLGRSRLSEEFRNEVADVLNCRRDSVDSAVKKLPYGKVLCVVRLVSIEETSTVREIVCKRDRIFGNYEDGRYAWFMEMVEKFEEPIPAKGHQQLWNWNDVLAARWEPPRNEPLVLGWGPKHPHCERNS